ncbi:MAG: hypothetical protein KatS3mg079_091 [Caloramator sp.]|uniref:hypothetical protein n=1 Tax=Caloramator sp. ALD01 TaxID=1031288 RepID=UPI000418FF28|nr:hypothetical protein [Caloramator sp. ALD01]GIW48615.1 MAG: hypothetical protein KatS3mg079_091 [Caloramator sp.]
MDVLAIQDVINKIEGVIKSKVVKENNEISEIHILANTLKSPKQILRDIESALYAMFDIKIDRNKISIAAIQSEDVISNKRVKFNSVQLKNQLNTLECSVTLMYDDNEYTVEDVAINTSINKKKLVSKTTLKAVETILGQEYIFDVQDVLINTSNDISVVTVIVNALLYGTEEVLVGSALVKNDVNETIARATLDAINRVIQKITS